MARFPVPNTLALPATSVQGGVVAKRDGLSPLLGLARSLGLPLVPVGHGSNLVPADQVNAVVAHMQMRGIQRLEQDAEHVLIEVAAGEDWHALVLRTLREGWYGLENLALIPGTVGAAPVQNIGAYGVELSEFVVSVEVMDAAGKTSVLDAQDCAFAYRESRFKQERDLVILSIKLRLRRQPLVRVDYPGIQAALAARHIESPTPGDVAAAVMAIRQAKLPNPRMFPNAGSFFKNPLVSEAKATALGEHIKGLQAFATADGVKLSAAQLIDRAGWKARSGEHTACWHRQPLVLINTDRAGNRDVLAFAAAIQEDVLSRYGVQLELEPRVLS